VAGALHCFAEVGFALIQARQYGDDPFLVLDNLLPWSDFEAAVHNAQNLTGKIDTSPLDFLPAGYARLRRYTPRCLASFAFQGSPAARPLLDAIGILREMNASGARYLPAAAPVSFVRDN
jgi:hypothetical protein